MAQPLKKDQLIGLFGEKAGLKLYRFLNDCCDGSLGGCCPAQIYNLQVAVDCSHENPLYTLYFSSSVTITSPLIVQVVQTTGQLKTRDLVLVNGVVKENQVTFATDIPVDTPTSLVLIDSRGNWSNVVDLPANPC